MLKYFSLRSIKREIAKQEVSISEKKKKQEEEEKTSALQTKRLGKLVYLQQLLEEGWVVRDYMESIARLVCLHVFSKYCIVYMKFVTNPESWMMVSGLQGLSYT